LSRFIIDVREPEEFARGHADGAINIPPARLMQDTKALKDIPKDAEVILYCVSGARSSACMHILRQMGYTNLVNGINKDHVNAKFSQ
jgi:phage shock protein E